MTYRLQSPQPQHLFGGGLHASPVPHKVPLDVSPGELREHGRDLLDLIGGDAAGVDATGTRGGEGGGGREEEVADGEEGDYGKGEEGGDAEGCLAGRGVHGGVVWCGV